jgi:hypothetical protein
MAGHTVLVKVVLTSVVIYLIAILEIPLEVLLRLLVFGELIFGRRVTRLRERNAR